MGMWSKLPLDRCCWWLLTHPTAPVGWLAYDLPRGILYARVVTALLVGLVVGFVVALPPDPIAIIRQALAGYA